MKTARIASLLISLTALVGCLTEADTQESIGESASALTPVVCPDVSGTDISRSLAVTDATVLSKFTFTRVMNAVRTSANVATTESTSGVYQRWMKTFGATSATGDCDDPSIDPNDYGLACPRPAELKLSTVTPFGANAQVVFEPVALFNRFDLAPSSGANCGEYRVVFAMRNVSAPFSGRAFIIFEATLPNPNPAQGIEACLPVARFWQGLSTDASATSRAAKLEKFYFTGTAVPGFAPVVQAANYGLSTGTAAPKAGQIRTNFFIDFASWHLREFKLNRQCTDTANPATCKLNFAHVTVKENPAEELFAGTHANSAAFRTDFGNQVKSLAATDVTKIKMKTGDKFNEWESVSQASNVVYSSREDAAMRTVVQGKLTALASTLTVDNVLDRATTQTCAGCHQVSNGRNLGGGLVWPSSGGFVHVDEGKTLSPALTTKFLPARKATLESFINARCTPALPGAAKAAAPPPAEPGTTVGGSPEGSAN
jgi:hypothetical protein